MNEIRKLNMSDLFMNLAKKWKQIIVAMLVLGLFVGAYSYLKNRGNVQEVQTEQTEIVFSDADQIIYQRQEDSIRVCEELHELYTKYLDESIKMQLNPESFFEGTVKCLITGETQTDVLRLRSECEDIIKSKEFCDAVRETLNIELDDSLIHEVVYTEFESYEDPVGLLKIKVLHFDKEACSSILDIIQEKMQQINSDVCQFEVLAPTISETSKLSLAEEKDNYNIMKWGFYDKLVSAKRDRKNLEASYAPNYLDSASQNAGVNKKYLFAAMFAGAVLCVLFYGLKYLFSERIHAKQDINGLTDVPLVTAADKKKQYKLFVDRWIDKLEQKIGNKPSCTLEMSLLPIITSVKQKDISEVCLTGTMFADQKYSEMAEQVPEIFAKYDVKVKIIDSILGDLDALHTAINVGNIVFYEICEKTKHKNMSEEVLKAQQCGIGIQGIILEK